MTIKVQKIKPTYKSEKIVYRAMFDNYSDELYIIDGEEVIVPSKAKMSFAELPEIYSTRKINFISHYTSSTGDTVSVDAYTNYCKELKEKGGYYDGEWSDIDMEYQFKKYTQGMTATYETKIERTLATLVVSGVYLIDTGDEYIISDYIFNETSPLCRFNIHKFGIDTFTKLITDAGYTPNEMGTSKSYHIPNHSGLRFAKINQAYVFGTRFETKADSKFTGTLEQCIEKKEAYKKEIEQLVDTRIRANNNMLKISNSEIVDAIDRIARYADDVKYMKGSAIDMINLKGEIKKLRDKL